MEKKLIIAIALSVLVVVVFQKFITPPQQSSTPPPSGQYVSKGTSVPTLGKRQGEAEGLPFLQPKTPLGNEQQATDTVIETDRFILTFTDRGGALKGVTLKEYEVTLIDEQNPSADIFSINFTNLGEGVDDAIYHLSQEQNKLTYFYENQEHGVKIVKEYIIHNHNDYIELQLFIDNISNINMPIAYNMFGPSGIQPLTSMKGRNFIEANAEIDGRIIRKSRVRKPYEILRGIVSWVALKNRYFTLAMQPSKDCEGIFIKPGQSKQLSTGFITKPRVVQPQSSIQDSYLLYMGPIEKTRLANLNIGLEGIISYGLFGGISTFLLSLLAIINSVVHNWGCSIILITILINIVLFPLTKKSFSSMQKMQELQPHMEKIKKIHKDNPQKVNKEIMQLYKQYNVNPFGGCLPMLLQMPIFISFYQALMRSIQLKNAKFLWIKDLSGPDALFTFAQPLPLIGDKLNLLPIITLIIMVLQQRITMSRSGTHMSDEMAKQQKFMAFFFPIFFGFILYNFPSGLVLYWLTNSVLMTTEQYLLRKNREKPQEV